MILLLYVSTPKHVSYMDKNLAHAKTLLLPTKNSQTTSRESDSHVIRPSTLQPREIYATVDRAKYFFRSRCCRYHLLHFRVGRNSKALVHRLNRKKWGQPVTKCFSAKYQEVKFSLHTTLLMILRSSSITTAIPW